MAFRISPLHPIGLFDQGLALSLTVDALEHNTLPCGSIRHRGTDMDLLILVKKPWAHPKLAQHDEQAVV
jgi:hypothetical protein